MGEDSNGQSWWKTLPAIITGLLTATAGLIGAVTLLIQNASGLATTWHDLFQGSPAAITASNTPTSSPTGPAAGTPDAAPVTAPTTTTVASTPDATAATTAPAVTPTVPEVTASATAPTPPPVPTVPQAGASSQPTASSQQGGVPQQDTQQQPVTQTASATPPPPHCPTTEADIIRPVVALRDAWQRLDFDLYMAQWTADATQVLKTKSRGLAEIRAARKKLFAQLASVNFGSFEPHSIAGGEAETKRVDNRYNMTFLFKDGHKVAETEREFYILKCDLGSITWKILQNTDYLAP